MMLKTKGASFSERLFEIHFLQVSSEYYKSKKLIECCDFSDYLGYVENQLVEEMIRVSHYSDVISQKKIVEVMCKEMIGNHMLRLFHMENSWLAILVDDNENCVPIELRALQKAMSHHVRKTGEQFVRDPERSKDPVVFVQELLDKKDKYDTILNLAFNNDEKFRGALDSSFEYIINLNQNLPEFLSLFLDVKLRKGFEGVREEIILDKVVMFIKLLFDKDLFHKYYKMHLAKRLLFKTTLSEDTERSLAVKLKRACGYKFAALETMVADMKTSKEMLQGFYRSHAELSEDPDHRFVAIIENYRFIMQPSN